MKTQNTGKANAEIQKFESLKRQAIEENERVHGEEARARYGDKTVDAANEKLLRMDQREWTDVNQLGEDILQQLSSAMELSRPRQRHRAKAGADACDLAARVLAGRYLLRSGASQHGRHVRSGRALYRILRRALR